MEETVTRAAERAVAACSIAHEAAVKAIMYAYRTGFMIPLIDSIQKARQIQDRVAIIKANESDSHNPLMTAMADSAEELAYSAVDNVMQAMNKELSELKGRRN